MWDPEGLPSATRRIPTLPFIEAVRARKELWQLEDFHKMKANGVMNSKWKEIHALFPDFKECDLKKRWKTLKDAFRTQLKRFPIPPKSEGGTWMKSRWKHFDSLLFLRYDVTFQTPLRRDYEHVQQRVEKKKMLPPKFSKSSLDNVHISNIRSFRNEPELKKVVRNVTSSTPRSNSEPSSGITFKQDFFKTQNEKIKLAEQSIKKLPTPKIKNQDDYHFFMSLMPQMSSLPVLTKMKIRQKMLQIFMDESKSMSR